MTDAAPEVPATPETAPAVQAAPVNATVRKSILRTLRDGLQWLLHALLVPVVAVLKGVDGLVNHLLTEVGKI